MKKNRKTYINLQIVPEQMIRVDIDPAVDEKPLAFLEDIPSIPSGIDLRAESRDKVYTLRDVVERYDFGICLTVSLRVGDYMHLHGGIDFAEWPEPLNICEAKWNRRDSFR